MRILLIAPTPPPTGGIARWTETVLNYCEGNDNAELVHINTGNNTESIANRTIYERFVGSMLRVHFIERKIKEICKKEQIYGAHITTSAGFGLVRDFILVNYLKKRNIKVVYHLHFGRLALIKAQNTKEYKLIRKVISLSDAVIAMDPTTYEAIDFHSNKYFVPNPINEVEFCYSEEHTIAFIGYVIKEKGIAELCKAWKEIDKMGMDWRLEIIGPYEQHFIDEINSLGLPKSIAFIGELPHDDAMNRLKESSILVLPSYSEGFPYSICEAMYAGKAIVGTNVGAIPFLLKDDCGVICDKQNEQSLKKALLDLMRNEKIRKKLAFNAAQKARKTFTVSKVVAQYSDIWRSVFIEEGKNCNEK